MRSVKRFCAINNLLSGVLVLLFSKDNDSKIFIQAKCKMCDKCI
jgi:hypothetical protein